MAPKPISSEKPADIKALRKQGYSLRQISKLSNVSLGKTHQILKQPIPEPLDKKRGKVNWREMAKWARDGQDIKGRMSSSNDFGTIKLGDGSRPIILATFSDTHIGAWGSDYREFERMTNELITTPNLYVALLGDYCEFAIKLRSVLETTSQVFTPDMQLEFLEDWLMEIKPKVAFATWDNHAVEREEKQSGVSGVKRLLSKNVMYFNGIGHVDIRVGRETYKIAASHRFKQGSSTMNPCASMMRYMRFEGLDREICMQGDTHKPGMTQYKDGNLLRLCINAGTLHLNSGYAKRYFSLFTAPDYPCLVLYPDKHIAVPFWSIPEAVRHIEGK